MASARVAYSARSDASFEGEINTLASVYCFILDSHAKKKGARPGAPDDAKGPKNDRAATRKYT